MAKTGSPVIPNGEMDIKKPPGKSKRIAISDTHEAQTPATHKAPKVPASSTLTPASSTPTPSPESISTPPVTQPKDVTPSIDLTAITLIPHSDLYPFKLHPFQLRDDDDMKALVTSVKERGVDQPALVRPKDGGGYELIAGHRRQHAAHLAGHPALPCIIREMNDDEAVLAMTESNLNQRSSILASERAQALKMQLEAIKHQGSKESKGSTEISRRSNEIVAERNTMSVKNVQRYISLTRLIPELMEYVDNKKMKFTVAVELSYVRPKHQRYIAVAMDAQQSAPTGAQAQRLRELDQKDILSGDIIDGIMTEDKKEEIKVIINGQELGKYFGADKTPREMKEQILKILDDWKSKQPPELSPPARKQTVEK